MLWCLCFFPYDVMGKHDDDGDISTKEHRDFSANHRLSARGVDFILATGFWRRHSPIGRTSSERVSKHTINHPKGEISSLVS